VLRWAKKGIFRTEITKIAMATWASKKEMEKYATSLRKNTPTFCNKRLFLHYRYIFSGKNAQTLARTHI